MELKWKIKDLLKAVWNSVVAIVKGNFLTRLHMQNYFMHILYTFFLFGMLIWISLMIDTTLNKVEKNDIIIPAGAEVRIIQNTDDVRYIILPASPKSLSKQELAMAAGGDSANVVTTVVETSTVVETVASAVTVSMIDQSPTAAVSPTVSVSVIGVAVLV